MFRQALLSACLILSSLSAPSVGFAQPVADNAASDLDARLLSLDAYLKDLERPSRAYFGAWISILGGLALGQGTLAVFEDDKATRARYIVGSGLSTAGLTLVLIAPTPGRYGSSRYRRLPSGTVEEKQSKLIQGETWLAGEARAVRRTRSWFTHGIAVTFGVGSALYLGLAFEDNWDGALITGVGTFLITEARVWSRPTRALRYLDDYRSAPTVTPTFAVVPMLLPQAMGLSAGGTF